MNLNSYSDVHPNWNLIESLDQPQAEATLDLLTYSLLADGDFTEDEFDALAEELAELPFLAAKRADVLEEELDKTVARLESFDQSPDRFDEFLDETCSKIESEEIQMAVLRLLAVDITIAEPTEGQQDFFYAVGDQWNVDYSTLESILTAAWESHEESRDLESGRDHHVPPIRGANWAKNRSLNPAPDPFTQRET